MVYANIYEAKAQLSKLIAQVEAGEEVILSRAGKPVARIVPWSAPVQAKRQLGLLRGKIHENPNAWDFSQEDASALMAAEPLYPAP